MRSRLAVAQGSSALPSARADSVLRPNGLPPARGLYASRAQAPDALVYAVGAMLLTYVWRINNLWHGVLGPFRLALVATLFATGCWVLSAERARGLVVLTRLKLVRLVFALAAVVVLSIPAGIYPGFSFDFVRQDYATLLLFFLVSAAAVRSTRDLELLFKACLVGAIIYSLFVLSRYNTQTTGRLGHLVYHDANDFAMLLVCSMPLAVYFLGASKKLVPRLIGLGALLLFSVMLVQTGSRGGFLGFVAVMTYLVFRYKALSAKVRTASVVLGFGTLLVVGSGAYWDQMGTIFNPKEDYNYAGQADHGRMEIWKRGINYMLERPFFGVGARNFSKAEGSSAAAKERAAIGRGFRWTAAHNSFVQVGAELGVTGLALFLATLIAALKGLSLTALKSPDPRVAQLAQALIGSIIGYVVAGFFLSQGYSAFLYGLIGMTAGLLKVAGLAPDPRARAVLAPAASVSRGTQPHRRRSALPSR